MVTKPLNEPRKPLNDEDIDLEEALLTPTEEAPPIPPPPEITPERSGPAWRILLDLSAHQGSSIGLDIWRVTVLGRADPLSAFRPDIDFAPYGAIRHGISRRHALIRPEGDSLFLVDQNSTNGVWVNGQRLISGHDIALSDGDILEIGALRMTLRIVESPDGKVANLQQDQGKQKPSSDKRRRFGWPRQ